MILDKKISFLTIVRDFSFAFLLIWLINPQTLFSDYYNWYLYGLVLLLWIISAALADSKTFLSLLSNKYMLLLWLWPIYLLIASLFGHAEFSIKQFTTPFIFFFFPYYSKKRKGVMFNLTIICALTYIAIVLFNTIKANELTAEVSRLLAHGDSEQTFYLSSPFVANFSYSYSLVGLAITFFIMCKEKASKAILKLLVIAGFVFTLFTVISTQYMIALCSIIVFSVIIFFFYNELGKSSLNKRVFSCFCFFCFLFLFIVNYQGILRFFYNIASGDNIKYRLTNLMAMFGDSEYSEVSSRPKLYFTSIRTFFSSFENFILGVGYKADYSLVGKHSQLFDTFAYYGVLGGSAWLMTIVPSIKVLNGYCSVKSKKAIKYIIASMCLIAVLNPCYTDLFLVFNFFLFPTLIERYHDLIE